MRVTLRGFVIGSLLVAGSAVSIPAFVEGQELPNKVDLQVAYCIPIVKHLVTLLLSPDNENPGDEEELNQLRFDLNRLQAYLAPRMQNMDILSIQAEQSRAEEDLDRGESELESCLNLCQDKKCQSNCAKQPIPSIKKCSDLTSLMY